MAKKLLPRRGSESAHSTFIGDIGEITVDLTNHSVVVHDGETPGGWDFKRDLTGANGAGALTYTASGSNAVKRTAASKLDEFVSVKDYGGTGLGNDTLAFSRAALAAETSGAKTIYVPFSNFQVDDGVNGRQCRILGSQTTLTGRINNHGGLENIIVNGKNQSDKQLSPQLKIDSEPRILLRQSSLLDYVIQRKRTRGYLLAGFVIDSTTADVSLAISSKDANRRRLSEVIDAVWVGVYKYTPSALVGAGWTTTTSDAGTVFANMIPPSNKGLPIKRHTTSGNGQYIEYTTKQSKGAINVAFLTGSSSCETAQVSVNGTVVSTLAIRSTASNTIRVFTIPIAGFAEDQVITVRVTHTGTGGTALGVIGVNFYELKDWDGNDYDSFAYYRNELAFSNYLIQSSSNDTVIQEFNSQIYGVAYHGGETNLVHDWYVDGLLVNPPPPPEGSPEGTIGGFIVGKRIELRTSADVDWGSVNGGSVSITAKWEFGLGTINHTARYKGNNLEVRELYAHMFGTHESFSEIIYPDYIDLTTRPDNSRNNVGRTNKIVLRNPVTGQTYTGELTLYEREQNRYGGVHVWKKVGQYHKVYYGPVLGGRYKLEDFTCSSVHTFE